MIMVDVQPNSQSNLSVKKELTENNCRQRNIECAKGDFIERLTIAEPQGCYPNSEMSGPNPGNAGLAANLIPYLKSIREPLAEYQEKKGISRTQWAQLVQKLTSLIVNSLIKKLTSLIVKSYPSKTYTAFGAFWDVIDRNYTFFALVSTVAQYIYSVLVSLGQMVYNLFPILDAFLLILRFILDKAIDCLQAKNNEKYVKGAVFFVECIAIILMIVVISGLILAPLSVLFGHMFTKVWNALFS